MLVWKRGIVVIINKLRNGLYVPTTRILCPTNEASQMLVAFPHRFNHGWLMFWAYRAKGQRVVKTRVIIRTFNSSKVIIWIIHISNYPSVFYVRTIKIERFQILLDHTYSQNIQIYVLLICLNELTVMQLFFECALILQVEPVIISV